MAKRLYHLISTNKKGISVEIGKESRNASYRYWLNYEKPLIKKDEPKARVEIVKSRPDYTLVEQVVITYPNGSQDRIIAHAKYIEMLKQNKFNFGKVEKW